MNIKIIITNCDKNLSQIVTGIAKGREEVISKCGKYYKVWHLLQSETSHCLLSAKLHELYFLQVFGKDS